MDQTPIQPQAVVTQPQTQSNVKKSNKGCTLIALGCIAILCVVVVGLVIGLFAAYQSNNNIPVLSDLVEVIEKIAVNDKTTAKKVTSDAAGKLDTLKTSGTNTTLPDAGNFPKVFKYGFKLNGESNPTSGKVTFTVNGSGQADVSGSNLKVGLNMTSDINTQGVDYKPALDARVLGDKTNPIVYFNISGIPSAMLSSLPDVNNKWVKIDVNKDLSSFMSPGTTETPIQKAVDPAEIDKVKAFIQSDVIINNFKRTNDQVFDGVRAYCFEENISGNQIPLFYAEIDKLNDTKTASSDNSLQSLIVDGCFGRKDNLPYKLSMSTVANSAAEGKSTAGIEITFTDFNKPVTVEEPKADLTFQDLAQKFLQSYLTSQTSTSGSSSLLNMGSSSSSDSTGTSDTASIRDSERLSSLGDIYIDIADYYATNNSYPTVVISSQTGTAVIGTGSSATTVDLTGASTPSIGSASDSTGTVYCYETDGTSYYRLGAYLENDGWGKLVDSVEPEQQMGNDGTNLCTTKTNI